MANRQISYVCAARQIHVIDALGRHRPQTTAEGDGIVWGSWASGPSEKVGHSWPTWSPDGRCLAFTSTRSGRSELYLSNRDGRFQRKLSTRGGVYLTPSWGR